MSLKGFFYVLVISGILLTVCVGLIRVIHANFRDGQRIRESLRERIRMLRLGKMLKKRGIAQESYLHEATVHDIESNIRNCERCEKVRECENVLAAPAATVKDMSFCPNDLSLKKYGRDLD